MNTFEVTIERRNQDAWPVVVLQAQAGSFLPVRTEGTLKLDVEAALRQFDPKAYGEVLGKALFVDEVRDAFTRALTAARDSTEKSIRVLLFVEADDLRALHWERTCAPIDGKWGFLSLNQQTPLSLYLPSQVDRRFPPIGSRDLRALVLVADPSDLGVHLDLAEFDVPATVAGIRTGLGPIPSDVLATTDGASGQPTLGALLESLTAQPYTMLHIVCHGALNDAGETVLYMPGDDGKPVTATTLIERLERIGNGHGLPQFCFLCACESADPRAETGFGGLAQRLVRELGMPSVLAMTARISIETAQAFGTAYYQRLREHGQPDLALPEALVALQGRFDATVPALMSRLGGRPMFSDTADRPLTDTEISDGLGRLKALFAERAPVLLAPLAETSTRITQSLESDQPKLVAEREADLLTVRAWCDEVVTISFENLTLQAEPPAYDARCPFKGMAAFQEADAEFFFGREPEITRLADLLGNHPFLAVLGASGSGKSSLVMAGLLPHLKGHAAVFTPSAEPLARMEQARASHPDLLVIDQFEELFTLCKDEAQRTAFIVQLLSPDPTTSVVLTMRADFWGDCAPYLALKAAMQAHQELIAPMDAVELRRAMELQAAAVGLRFEADLTNTLLDEVQGEPGAMPLLQHALLELWKRRHGRWLRADEYRAIGGVRQAVAHTADELYGALSGPDKERVQDIFVRLTRLDDDPVGGEVVRDTRRRIGADELVPAGGDPATTRELISRLATARLVVTSVNPTTGMEEVEVAHEALIRYWPLLRRWLDDGRANLRLREGIRDAAREWDAGGRSDELLAHRGSRLEDAVRLSKQPRFALNALEQAYVDSAVAAQQREMNTARARRRLRVLFAVVAPSLTAIAIVVGFLAFQANQARQEAEAFRLAGDARAAFDSRLDLGLLLALQAGAHSKDLQVQATTLVGLTRGAGPRQFQDTGSPLKAAVLDGSGSHAGLLREDSTVVLWDIGGDRSVATVPDAATAVAMSRDGSKIAIGRTNTVEVRAWSGASLLSTCPAGGEVQQLRMSDDGDLLVVVTADQGRVPTVSHVALVATTDCRVAASTDVQGLVVAADIDTAAERIALGILRGGVIVLDARTAESGAALQPDSVTAVAVALGDQDRLAALTTDGNVLIWNSHSGGDPLNSIHVFEPTGTAMRYRADGSLLTAAMDSQLRVVAPSNTDSPVTMALQELPHVAYGASIGFLDLASTDTGAITIDPSGRIVRWDLTARPPLGPQLLSVQTNLLRSMADGSVLTADANTLWLLDPSDGTPVRRDVMDVTALASREAIIAIGTRSGEVLVGTRALTDLVRIGAKHSDAVVGVALLPGGVVAAVDSQGVLTTQSAAAGAPQSHDLGVAITSMATNGTSLFLAAKGGSVHVVDAADLSRDVRFEGHAHDVTAIDASPDGRLLATGSDDRSIIVWDVAANGGLTQRLHLVGHEDKVITVAFSNDGQWIASGGEDHRVILWDLVSGSQIGDPVAVIGEPAVAFAASPNRQLLVSAGGVAKWDLRPEAWKQVACGIISGRSFDDLESQRYLSREKPSAVCP